MLHLFFSISHASRGKFCFLTLCFFSLSLLTYAPSNLPSCSSLPLIFPFQPLSCLSQPSSHFLLLLFSCLALPAFFIFSFTWPSLSLSLTLPLSVYMVYQVSGMVLWPAPIILSYSLMQTGNGNLSIKCHFKSVILTAPPQYTHTHTHTHTHLRGTQNNRLLILSLVCSFSLSLTFLLKCKHQLFTLFHSVSLSVPHKLSPVSSVSNSYDDSYSLVSLCISELLAAPIKTPSTRFSLPGDHC